VIVNGSAVRDAERMSALVGLEGTWPRFSSMVTHVRCLGSVRSASELTSVAP
jgi:hypothetical protein